MMRKNAANSDKARPSAVLKCVFMYHHSVADERCGRSCTLKSMGPGAGQSAGNRFMCGGCLDPRTRDSYCENFLLRNKTKTLASVHTVVCSADECDHQRMRALAERRQLGLKQRGDEKSLIVALDGAHLAVGIDAADAQRAAREARTVSGIESVTAVKSLDHLRGAVRGGDAAARTQIDRRRGPDERARQRRDQRRGGVGARFGVIGIIEAELGARVLDERVLKAAAAAEERALRRARKADGGERAVEAAIGAAGHAPQSRKAPGAAPARARRARRWAARWR